MLAVLLFGPGDKKSKFLSFLRSIFLVPFFLCSFLIPFTEDFINFMKSIFNILLFWSPICVVHFCDSGIHWHNSCSVRKSCIIIQIFYLFFSF